MTSFSFVIPTYNHWELTHQLLFDICQRCSQVDEVLVVDDGSSEAAVHQGLEWWKSTNLLPIKTLELKNNHGFLVTSNAGLKMASGDIVCLISNDVRVFGDLVASIKGVVSAGGDKVLGGGVVYRGSTGWNEFGGHIFPYVEGWLLFATKKAWQELGYFDQRYMPNDFEDVDISTTAKSKGFELMDIAVVDMVKHLGAGTYGYNPEREAITIRNRKRFADKWGVNV